MHINRNKSIGELRKEFSEIFQGLKLEFYNHDHKAYATSSPDDMISADQRLDELLDFSDDKEYVINEDISVAQLESDFKEIFNLNIQVFRKSKDLWLQTSATDDWSLAKQNSKGLHSMGIYE